MNKKRDTNNDSKRKKRCKSKNIDDKKWERPAGYYKEYETRRGGEGHVTRLRIKALAALLSEIYPSATSGKVRMIPYMVCLADREFRCHSYRQHVSYLQTHQGTIRMYGLKTVPSKSCLHHAATIIADYGWLHEIIERAGRIPGARFPSGRLYRCCHRPVRRLGGRQEGTNLQA